MAARPSFALVLIGALASLGASYRTANFVVEAPTPQFAEQVGKWAEHYRHQKAIEWIGHEMPTWGRPCPLRVTVTMNGSGGATSFAFDRGQILSIDMHIEGKADRLIASVLPHEVTHTVFAYYFRTPVPRWADEGGSVLSEDEQERAVHDHMVRQILQTQSRAMPLKRLFTLTEYPRDVMVLYAQGYSVTNFLVSQSSRSVFLAFIAQGMQNNNNNWDAAVRKHYPPYRDVNDLERAWVQHVLSNRQQPTQLASARGPNAAASPTSRQVERSLVERRTAPPALPQLGAPQPIFRGQAPDESNEPRPAARPDYRMPPPPPAQPSRNPQQGYSVPPPPAVRLGAPEFETTPPSMPRLGQRPPDPRSPVGWSE
ncbi:MAG TPA: hypothetical protein VH575_34625 [Gemmataceae bacterium]|jgi:hypothetical protein